MIRTLIIASTLIILYTVFISTSQQSLFSYLQQQVSFLLPETGQTQNRHFLPLSTLEVLNSVPLLGQFFLEEKVEALVRAKNWESVLYQCQKNTFLLNITLPLLPMRALAECATFQFVKCEGTILEISQKAPHLLKKISRLSSMVTALGNRKLQREMSAEAERIIEL